MRQTIHTRSIQNARRITNKLKKQRRGKKENLKNVSNGIPNIYNCPFDMD